MPNKDKISELEEKVLSIVHDAISMANGVSFSLIDWGQTDEELDISRKVAAKITQLLLEAEIQARIGMVEYYDQVSSNDVMDWKNLFKENLAQLKYELEAALKDKS